MIGTRDSKSKRWLPGRKTWLLMMAGIVNLGLATAGLGETQRIEIRAEPGLRFSLPRFQVEPGTSVELVLENIDEMQHNLVVTEPGAREEVAALALQLGSDGPAQDYVPDADQVLFHTPVLYHGETFTLSFEAPEEEGVYPYVCTFPGHAFVMYGAMYVTTSELPPLETDLHVPEYARVGTDDGQTRGAMHDHEGHATLPKQFRRTFVPEAGPAAIAVHVGRGLSYVWDATTCHLRYAWRGGFVDSTAHWRGNGSSFSVIQGHTYYRAGREFPIRLGDAEQAPKREFRGYRIVDDLPVFEFELDGYKVRQRIVALEDDTGLRMDFQMPEMDVPVSFVTDPDAGASFSASAGTWEDGVLRLSPEEAQNFTIRFVERPGHEPVGYWSMNDVMNGFAQNSVVEGVVGRAYRVAGKEIITGIRGREIDSGGTLAAWVRIGDERRENQIILGGQANEAWKLAFNADGASGFSLTYPAPGGDLETRLIPEAGSPGMWNHFAISFEPGFLNLYINGKRTARLERGALAGETVLAIAGTGQEEDLRLRGSLDEVRVWSRVLDESAIEELYLNEARMGGIVE